MLEPSVFGTPSADLDKDLLSNFPGLMTAGTVDRRSVKHLRHNEINRWTARQGVTGVESGRPCAA